MKRSIPVVPVVLVSLALVAAACGDDDDAATDTASITEAPAAATDAPAATDPPAATDAPAVTDAPTATEAPADTAAPGSTDAPAAAGGLELATTSLGDVVVDASGMTVYLFTPDEQGDASQCNGDCAESWPPVGEVTAVGDGLDAGLLGTITRDDGSVQATYNGWPLYLFGGDSAPGDVNGQGINDVWWVIDASGNSVAG
jgi:predicted lipoprotein with Yx(FWY)xxD motif